MLATDRPRFKQELVAEPIEDGGARFIDLMDPDSGNVFRFYEVEYALACAMDGERDVAGIVRWAQEELGLSPSAKEVQTVIATLGDLGYLDVRPPAETVAPTVTIDTAPTKPAKPDAPKVDEELAGGILVGKQASGPTFPAENYELGASGGSAPAPRVELPPAPDLALGKAGTSTVAKRPDPIAVDDIKLGASGANEKSAVPIKTDLSTDLSSDFSLRPDDVKEAVRASKVMSAVEMPQDLLDAVESKPEPKKVEPAKVDAKKAEPAKVDAKKAEPRVDVKAEPPKKAEPAKADAKKKSSEAPTEKLPDPKAVAAAAEKVDTKAKGTDKPKPAEPKKAEPKKAADAKKPVVEEKKPVVAPTAPKSGVSPALIILLMLAVLGGGVFLVWKYVLDKPATGTSQVTPPKQAEPPPAPPAPPAPTAKLALDTPAPVDVKPPAAGTLETIEANDKLVKVGDVVAKLAGNAPIQAALDALKKDADKAPAAVEAAQKELDAAKDDAAKAAAQTKLDAAKKAQDGKQQAVVTKQGDLDKLLVKATADGKLIAIAKKDAKVAETDVVAKIAQEPMLAATFTAPGGKYVAGSPATLGLKGGGDKKLSCTVADVQGDQVKVVCTADASIPAGADVTLE